MPAGAIALALGLVAPIGAAAQTGNGDGNANIVVTPGESGVGAGVATPGDETGGAGSGSARSCWFALDADSEGKPKWPILDPSGEIAYAWFFLSCDGKQVDVAPYLLAVGGSGTTPAARTLAEQAFKFLPLPAPAPAFNPPGSAVVGVATWLWTSSDSWGARQVRVGVTGLTVRVRATAVTLTWRFGERPQPLVCHGAGTRYEPNRPMSAQHTDCVYTFDRSSAGQPGGAYRTSVTTEWRIDWVASDGTSGVLAPLPRTTTFGLPVTEVQTVVTQPQGGRR